MKSNNAVFAEKLHQESTKCHIVFCLEQFNLRQGSEIIAAINEKFLTAASEGQQGHVLQKIEEFKVQQTQAN